MFMTCHMKKKDSEKGEENESTSNVDDFERQTC